jgi:hypothetical protein
MASHLAEVNIARLRAPIDSPEIADFKNALDEINALAESSPGFVWRFKTDSGDATEIRAFDDPAIIVNLSVWTSVEALRDYAYRTMHGKFFARRNEWFHKMETPHLALWWIPAGTLPTVEEARRRLEHRERHGDSAFAFSFKTLFPADTAVVAP